MNTNSDTPIRTHVPLVEILGHEDSSEATERTIELVCQQVEAREAASTAVAELA